VALALYRKYRPATFAEVVGQEHVTEPLRTALAAGRINHAYLFSGPRGCGKTSSARIMARSLNCAQGPTADPCGTCDSCVGLAPEGPGSVDVVELDAASHGGVDDARELRDRAFFAPAESRYRVFIIDEAHMVTTQGFNALLKIVEEPPEHLIFIFATTEPDKVLTTIRSRTHHYPFRLIPPGAMRELLERNVAAEGVAVEPTVFPLVIRAGGGSARDTQSVLDQLLAGAGPDGVTYERAVALLRQVISPDMMVPSVGDVGNQLLAGEITFGGIDYVDTAIESLVQQFLGGAKRGMLIAEFGAAKAEYAYVQTGFSELSIFHSFGPQLNPLRGERKRHGWIFNVKKMCSTMPVNPDLLNEKWNSLLPGDASRRPIEVFYIARKHSFASDSGRARWRG
jgi:DNA polymerase III subunit gamma/tau